MATIVIDAYFLVTKCRDVRQSCGDLDTDLIRNDESDLFKYVMKRLMHIDWTLRICLL